MRRRALLLGIVAIVVAAHVWVGREFSDTLASWREAAPPMAPMEVSVSGALKPVQPLRKLRAPPRTVPPPAEGIVEGSTALTASAGGALAAAPTIEPLPAPQTLPAELPSAAAAGDGAASAPAAVAAAADPWPPSTRIRYSLRGNYRGEFSGHAQVLWLRDADRYRVELEVSIGPRAAPIMSRKVVSEGSLGAAGLTPRRYEEDTRVLFSRARRVSMTFEPPVGGQPGTMVLQDGTRRPAPPGTQDSASQFVQLAWLFGTHPTPVKAGDRVTFPLALSRRSDQWSYIVGEPVTVDTAAGPVQTIHARPQREVDPLKRDLIAEVWFAPSLQYLPVRMQVVVDADSFALLVMEGMPELVTTGLPAADRLPGAQVPSANTPGTPTPGANGRPATSIPPNTPAQGSAS